MVEIGEAVKGGGAAVGTSLGVDMAEGNGLDIASQAVGDAVANAREVLSGLGLDLPFALVVDVIGVMP